MAAPKLPANGSITHVGIIMDGNGRWAKSRGLPRAAGHKRGAHAFERIVRHAKSRGIPYLTVYAFSTENHTRPESEILAIKGLLRDYLGEIEKHKENGSRVHFLGDVSWLSDSAMLSKIASIERDYEHSDGVFTLNIAFNYGGRDEILRAAKNLAKEHRAKSEDEIDSLTENEFSRYLYTSGQPEVDLIIRTSGEQRISNFLLWQAAYAEYIFTEKLWPDFTPRDFDDALAEFALRNRRMGGVEGS